MPQWTLVRRIFLTLDNSKYEKLLKIKGDKTWERLLVDDLLEREGPKPEKLVVLRQKADET